MTVLLIIVIGLGGLWLSIRQFRRNLLEIKAQPKATITWEDRFLNYPLTVIWFGYLIVFFAGLIINNLIIR